MINKLKKEIVYFVIFIISFVLVAIWFREGHYLGGGDIGLPFYNPTKTLNIARYLWWGRVAPGFSYPQTLSSLPLYTLLSLVQKVLIEPYLIQAFLNFVILVSSGIFFYLLTGEFIDKEKKWWRLFGVGSYIFSAYMMDSVWHRFAYTTIILSAVLPMSIWLFIKLLKSNKFYFFFLLQLLLIAFSYIFGTFSHVVTLWTTLAAFGIIYLCLSDEKPISLKKLLFWTFSSFIVWLGVNLWWLLPQLEVTADIFHEYTTFESNLSTLIALSERLPIQYVIRGINKTYFFDKNVWGEIYSNPLFFSISWLPVIVILVGFVIRIKNKRFLTFFSAWLVVIFLAKGTAPPLGGIFKQLFSLSFFIGIYRNTFEKMGLLIPFFSAFLLTFSWQEIYEKINKKSFKILISMYVFLLWFVFLWPFWTGDLFGEIRSRDVINPPKSYQKIDDDIKINEQYRVLHLPLTEGGVTYGWNPPYSGIDPIHTLFSHEAISNTFGIKYIDAALKTLSSELSTTNNENSILALLQAFSVKYLILHKDVEWKEREMINPLVLQSNLNSLYFLSLERETDELLVYEVEGKLLYQKLYFTNGYFAVSPPVSEEQKLLWSYVPNSALKTKTYISSASGFEPSHADFRFYFPTKSIEFPENRIIEPGDVLGGLVYIRFLPTSPLYPLIQIKERVETFLLRPSEMIPKKIDLAGKRIVELFGLLEIGDVEEAKKTLEEYDNRLDEMIVWNEESGLVRPAIIRHYNALKEAEESYANTSFISNYLEIFVNKLDKNGVLPHYRFAEAFEIFDKKVIQFDILKEGNFEILIEKPIDYNILAPLFYAGLEVYVDGQKQMRSVKEMGTYLSLGEVEFNEGIHEIAYTPIASDNLVDTEKYEELIMESEGYFDSTLTFPINNYSPGSGYRIRFDQEYVRGNGVSYRIVQDSDPIVDGKRIHSYAHYSTEVKYIHNDGWTTIDFGFNSRRNSQAGSLEFLITPWDGCLMKESNQHECKTERYKYQNTSQVKLKNISVVRVFKPQIILANLNAISSQGDNDNLISNVQMVNPTKYLFDLNIKEPGMLIFSESYYPKWDLYLDGRGVENEEHLIGNIFANAWHIRNAGIYSGVIEFTPQKHFMNYGIISIAIGTFSLFVIYKISKNINLK